MQRLQGQSSQALIFWPCLFGAVWPLDAALAACGEDFLVLLGLWLTIRRHLLTLLLTEYNQLADPATSLFLLFLPSPSFSAFLHRQGYEWRVRVVHDGVRSEIVGMDLGNFGKLLRVLVRLGKVKAVRTGRLEPLSVVSHQYKIS